MTCSPSRKGQCSAVVLYSCGMLWHFVHCMRWEKLVMSVWIEQSLYEGQLNASGLLSMKKGVQAVCDRRLWIYEWDAKVCRAFPSLTLQLLVAQIVKGWHGVLGKHHCLLPLIWWLPVTNTGKILARWIFSPSCCGCSCSYVGRNVYVRGWGRILSKIHKKATT